MHFHVDFDWATQAIIETVAIAFPSLESPQNNNNNNNNADPPPPVLEASQSGPNYVTDFGNGRWNRASSYRFNAGCNRDIRVAPSPGDKGIVSPGTAVEVYNWFRARYPNNNPQRLTNGSKMNLCFVRQHCVYNFHLMIGDDDD
jgi:hypothetical protein